MVDFWEYQPARKPQASRMPTAAALNTTRLVPHHGGGSGGCIGAGNHQQQQRGSKEARPSVTCDSRDAHGLQGMAGVLTCTVTSLLSPATGPCAVGLALVLMFT
jgi:hypothetical protein